MSYERGIAIGNSLANIGGTFAYTMRHSQQDDMKQEKFQWDKQAHEQDQQADQVASILSEQGDKADLSQFDPISRFRGAALYADAQAKQQRNSAEGLRLEKEKMGMSLQRVQNIGREYFAARESGDNQMAEELAMQFMHHARNGVREAKDLGDGKVQLDLLDSDNPKEMPKPTPEQMDKYIEGYLSDPATHIKNRLAEKQKIQEHNFQVANSPQLWKNKAGQEIIATVGYVDPETRAITNQYVDANTMQPIPEEQVKAGGFMPPSVSKDRADFAKSAYETERSNIGMSTLYQPEPDSITQTRGGNYIGKTGGGQIVDISPQQADMMMPKEKPKLNMVTNDKGEYTYIEQPTGGSDKVKAIGTGVKAPRKAGAADDKVYTVKNAVTKQETQETGKDIKAKLKIAQDLLKDVKDSNGKSFILPDYDSFVNASKKDKETVIARVKRLASNSKDPMERNTAGQVLGYLSALSISSGTISWKDLIKDDDGAAVIGN